MIKDIMEFNKEFVNKKEYEKYATTKFPTKKIAILSCMDTRLTALLPAALGLKNGDAKIIKNAGALISHPFGSVMRSLVVAIYELGVEEVMVIGHKDCGMQRLDCSSVLQKMAQRGISCDDIKALVNSGIDIDKWLCGFESVEDSICETVKMIANHPLIPKDISVYGLIIDPLTGELEQLA